MNILITGGSSGMGLSMARKFRELGHTVHVTSRRERKIPGLIVHELEVTNPESIRALAQKFAGVEIGMLVNNAGHGVLGPLTELTRDQMRHQFEANVFGPIELVSALLPNLKGGHLVNVSSISPEVGLPFGGIYTASKAAMNSVSDILRLELRHLNIKVTTVRPGLVNTHFARNSDSEVPMREGSSFLRFRESIQNRAALAEAGSSPEDFAEEVCPQLLKKNPPCYIYSGKGSFIWPLLKKILPYKWQFGILVRKYQLV